MANRASDFKIITIYVEDIDEETGMVFYAMAFDKKKKLQKPFMPQDKKSVEIVEQLVPGKRYAIKQFVAEFGTGWYECGLLDCFGNHKLKRSDEEEMDQITEMHQTAQENLSDLFGF